MPKIKFKRSEARVVTTADGDRELVWVTPVVDGVVMKRLEWEAAASTATVAEHLAWLHRNGLLSPAE